MTLLSWVMRQQITLYSTMAPFDFPTPGIGWSNHNQLLQKVCSIFQNLWRTWSARILIRIGLLVVHKLCLPLVSPIVSPLLTLPLPAQFSPHACQTPTPTSAFPGLVGAVGNADKSRKLSHIAAALPKLLVKCCALLASILWQRQKPLLLT